MERVKVWLGATAEKDRETLTRGLAAQGLEAGFEDLDLAQPSAGSSVGSHDLVILGPEDVAAARSWVKSLRLQGIQAPVLHSVGAAQLGYEAGLGAYVPVAGLAASDLEPLQNLLPTLRYLAARLSELGARLRDLDELKLKQRLELEDMHHRLQAIESDDVLTGLRSEKAMARSIDEAFQLARRYQTDVACLLVAVDGYGGLVERFGEAFADFISVQIAHRLHSVMRQTDLLSRYDVGQFLLLSPFTDRRGAELLTERLQDAVGGQRLEHEGEELELTLSIGVASWRLPMDSAQALVETAVEALATASREGPGGRFFA